MWVLVVLGGSGMGWQLRGVASEPTSLWSFVKAYLWLSFVVHGCVNGSVCLACVCPLMCVNFGMFRVLSEWEVGSGAALRGCRLVCGAGRHGL